MIQTVEKGKTLLIDGAACVQLLSGKASVLGASVKIGEKIVVRKGKRIPFEAISNVQIELTLSDPSSCVEIEGSSISPSWKGVVNEILSTKEYREILVIGGIDSGKTSLCTYLANMALDAKYKVALIDGDLGQSDIGPPGTIGLGFVQEPVTDLFYLQLLDAVFLGVTSPARMIDATLDAIAALKAKALGMGAEFLIVNTDGWVEGEDAVNYKVRLGKTVAPDAVLIIKSDNELDPMLEALKPMNVLVVDSPKAVKKRDRETRKILRESAYKRYLKDAKVRSYPLGWIKIEGSLEISLLKEGDEQGLLVALEDAHGKFLGIGTICDIDFEKEVIRIYTPVNNAVAKVRIGRIKLDKEGNEIELTAKAS